MWITTESGFGGFHLFTDRSSAEAYLDTPLAAGLMGTAAFGNFQVTHYSVLSKLSAVTGILAVAA